MRHSRTFPILVSYLVFIVIGVASGLLNIAWTYMQDTFGVSHDALAALAPAAMLGGLVAAFLNGALIGRFSLGPVLVGGMAAAGIGLLGYAVAPVWLLLLVVALFTSAGKGTVRRRLEQFRLGELRHQRDELAACLLGHWLDNRAGAGHFLRAGSRRGVANQLHHRWHCRAASWRGHALVAALVATAWQRAPRQPESQAQLHQRHRKDAGCGGGIGLFFPVWRHRNWHRAVGEHALDRGAQPAAGSRQQLGQRLLGQLSRWAAC